MLMMVPKCHVLCEYLTGSHVTWSEAMGRLCHLISKPLASLQLHHPFWIKVQSSEKHEEDFSDMWLLDSGASFHFISDIKDFVEYHNFPNPCYTQTANGKAPIVGHGTVPISYCGNVVCLSPTIYMPTCHVKLISLGTLPKNECLSGCSSKNLFTIYDKCRKKDLITFHLHGENTMYWICTPIHQ